MAAANQSLRVSMHVFSGRKDPMWDVANSDPTVEDLMTLLAEHPSGDVPSILGYKGFTVEYMVGGKPQCVVVGKGTNIPLETKLLETVPVTDTTLQSLVPVVKQALGIKN